MYYQKILVGSTFGGLEGIQFSISLPVRGLYVGGHAAGPDSPFDGRIGEAEAEIAGGKILDFLATFALLNNLVTVTSIKLTPCLVHKKALHTFL
jgi:hypothetical protein